MNELSSGRSPVNRVRVLTLLACAFATPALADLPPEIWSLASAENCGRFTIAPGGGEELAEAPNDYRIHLQILDHNGEPITTLAATDMWLDSPGIMATCDGVFSQADAGTDATGSTTFSGTIYSGLVGDANEGIDCNQTYLYVFALGIMLNQGDPVCVSVDSPDLNGDREVTLPDFARFVSDFNGASEFDPCHDFNEDGATRIADFGIFAAYFNDSVCP